jgi:hypothetical protein
VLKAKAAPVVMAGQKPEAPLARALAQMTRHPRLGNGKKGVDVRVKPEQTKLPGLVLLG